MTAEPARRGLLDTNIMILRSGIASDELPDEMAISAVTLAELSAGPHEVRPDHEQDVYFEAAERARRLDVLQRAEHEFDPIAFDADAARAYGRVTAAAIAAGRKPRRRAVDLMIAATAIAAELPLYTLVVRDGNEPAHAFVLCLRSAGRATVLHITLETGPTPLMPELPEW
jgi:predicted nucleic acid-binding protein